MDNEHYSYFGKGLYSTSEVARLSGASGANIRRWLHGYSYNTQGVKVCQKAIIEHDYRKLDGSIALSFLDLIEILFVSAFRKHGIPLQTIRVASRRAAALVRVSHPFATRRFFTDGKTILTDIAHELARHSESNSDANDLLNLVHQQYEIHDIVWPILSGSVEFGDFDHAQRWWPLGKDIPVVIDPRRNLGKPSISGEYVPTSAIARSYLAEQDLKRVANCYRISEEMVRLALDFEKNLAA